MRIDLNADLGEGFGRWELGDDQALLALVSSANVACGFHAGDPSVLRRTTAEAVERGVAIGAQVSYRDIVGFGRRFIDVPPRELSDEVIYQVGALEAFARLAGPALARARFDELPSEGMVPGALQVPPGGEPVLFLADHPVTGGYPVIAVVVTADLPRAAQARPGTRVRFRT